MTGFKAYRVDEVIPLPGPLYFDYVTEAIKKVKQRVWVTMFMISPLVEVDVIKGIRKLLRELQFAMVRNVDTRLLIGHSGSPSIETGNRVARRFLELLDVPVRVYRGESRRSLHSKYIVLDSSGIVVGSHNWTPGASVRENEDSVFMRSPALNDILGAEFLRLWNDAGSNLEEFSP